jgi:hypothetical protein
MASRTLAAVRRSIRQQWPSIVQQSGIIGDPQLPKSIKLLGSSTKIDRGLSVSVLSAVVYMAPDREAFAADDPRSLCPWATAQCSGCCIGTHTGRMIMSPLRNARLWKTALLLGARGLFRDLLQLEAAALQRKAERLGMVAAVRVDGSTDTGEGIKLAAALPTLQTYDYTKSPQRALRHARGELPSNYHVTFSHSGENSSDCGEVLAAGGTVAVVFDADPRSHEPIPSALWGRAVIDGDEHDARFLDPRGVVVGLRFKQARDRSGALDRLGSFVVRGGQLQQLAA